MIDKRSSVQEPILPFRDQSSLDDQQFWSADSVILADQTRIARIDGDREKKSLNELLWESVLLVWVCPKNGAESMKVKNRDKCRNERESFFHSGKKMR